MERSETQDHEKMKITEDKTFSVPLVLREIKENIIIHTNKVPKASKLSKEELINQAFKYHAQGNISEAGKYYQYFINQEYKDHRVFSNYGVILKNLGQLKEAELSTRKAIELNPTSAEAYSNLGSILIDLGQLKQAELFARKAIELNPNFAEAHSRLGSILRDLGQLQESLLCYEKAINLDEKLDEAKGCMGKVLLKSGDLQNGILKLREGQGSINFNYRNSNIIID